MQKFFKITRQALLASGDIIQRGLMRKQHISYKSIVSPVTQIDFNSQRAAIKIIRQNFPQHFFHAEESSILKKSLVRSRAGDYYRWVIDPLDGTTNFVHRIPHSNVSIALEKNGEVLVGGVYDPYRKELFMAAKSRGATLNNKKIQVSRETRMIKSLFITGFPYDRITKGPKYLAFVKPFLMKSMGVRRFGAAALDMAWIACGRSEGFFEYGLAPWDVAAGLLLVNEAGGKVTDFRNKKYNFDFPKQTLATNAVIHQKAIRLMKPFL